MDVRFTPHTAGLALERLRPLVERVRETHRRLESCPRGASDQPVPPAQFAMVVQWRALVAILQRQGVRLDDPRSGKIGFPLGDGWLQWSIDGGWDSHDESLP